MSKTQDALIGAMNVAAEAAAETAAAETAAAPIEGLALLRVDFPAHQISKLPRGGILLDYVGHAALTDRLLDADPGWNWEPVALTPAGLPAVDEVGGLWIRLTVCGLTRLGYGHAGTKRGGDAVKELIGDALRNAAMRFGAALDLWHKGDLHHDGAAAAPSEPEGVEADGMPWAGTAAVLGVLRGAAAQGSGALKAAWLAAPRPVRATITQHYGAEWNTLKAEAITHDS